VPFDRLTVAASVSSDCPIRSVGSVLPAPE
jgi:hypothetical protein